MSFNIVLIEDDPLTLEFMSDLLMMWGYKVQAFESADEALAWFLDVHETVSLLLTDLNLSCDFDGMDVIQRIRSNSEYSGLPAVLITGDVYATDSLGYNFKNIQILTKPIKPQELKNVIASVAKACIMS